MKTCVESFVARTGEGRGKLVASCCFVLNEHEPVDGADRGLPGDRHEVSAHVAWRQARQSVEAEVRGEAQILTQHLQNPATKHAHTLLKLVSLILTKFLSENKVA